MSDVVVKKVCWERLTEDFIDTEIQRFIVYRATFKFGSVTRANSRILSDILNFTTDNSIHNITPTEEEAVLDIIKFISKFRAFVNKNRFEENLSWSIFRACLRKSVDILQFDRELSYVKKAGLQDFINITIRRLMQRKRVQEYPEEWTQ